MNPNQPTNPEPTDQSSPPPEPPKNEEPTPAVDVQPTTEAPSDAAPTPEETATPEVTTPSAGDSWGQTSPAATPAGSSESVTPPMPTPASPEQLSTQPAVGSFGAVPASAPNNKKKKILVIALALVGVLALLGAAWYFLIWSKPETIWKTAMSRSNMVHDKLVEYAKDNKDQKGGTLKSDFKFEGAFAGDGTIEADYYENSGTFKADVGAVGSRITLEGRILDAANSNNPDVYLKAKGIKDLASLGGPEVAQMVAPYEDKWLSIDHTLFDSLSQMAGPAASNAQFTADDAIKVAEAIGKVNKEYLWTTDQKKAVLRVAENVGKETKDNRSVYHFKVGLNKQNAKDYVNAMVDTLKDTKVGEMFGKDKFREALGVEDMLKTIDSYKDTDTVDVYVDMGLRIIHTVRFVDKQNSKNSFELGLHYTGGDELPFVVRAHSDEDGQKSNANFEFRLNSKTNVATLNATAEFPSSSAKAPASKLSMKATVTPSNKKVDVQKPEGAVSLNQLLGGLMSGMMMSPSGGTMPSMLDTRDI